MMQGQLQRRLGAISAISITVGAVIGSGVFMKPLKVAQSMPSEWWIYVLWIGLGLVCLFGAFAYAELGAMFPEAGGQYAFLREGWGRGIAFLYGWTFFWIINSGTIAALSIAFAQNLLPLCGVDPGASPWATTGLAVVMILLLAFVNHFGVWVGAVLQNVSTFAKVGALALIGIGGVLVATGGGGDAVAPAAVGEARTELTLAGFVVAFTGIFWAYEGWYQLPFNAAELKRPARDLPLGLIGGMVVLILVYVTINAIYLHVVPFAEMRSIAPDGNDLEVARRTVSRAFSPDLAHYLTALVAISVMGSANPNLLSSPRAFYAMANDGLVPRALMAVHPRWGTPTVAIWTQAVCALAIVIAFSGASGFHDVTAYVVFAGFLFYALTVAAVYRLRRRRPDAVRTYRCSGYPWTPALFIAVAIAFVAALLLDEGERKNALYGLAIIAVGVPCYFVAGRRRAPAAV
jgi:APA family basic amino acid/polyamine antiporter